MKITDYNVLMDAEIFLTKQLVILIKQHDQLRKIATGKGDDYTARCLLDYQ